MQFVDLVILNSKFFVQNWQSGISLSYPICRDFYLINHVHSLHVSRLKNISNILQWFFISSWAHCFFNNYEYPQKKRTPCFLVLLGIHRNPNWKEYLKSCESFLRKSQFSTFKSDLDPGFVGPSEMLAIFLVNVIFIMLQRKSFGQIFFWFSCTGSKVVLLLKHYDDDIYWKYH